MTRPVASEMPSSWTTRNPELMSRIKEGFDPNGILNPGKLLPER